MIGTLHFQLLACHTLFQRTFLRNIRAEYPDLLPGQPKVIDFLMRNERAFQREIADGCLLEPPTLCLILDKMEKSGLVQRARTGGNRKNIEVSLTPKGAEIGRRADMIFRETEDRFCRGLDSRERRELSGLLQKIYHNAQEADDNAASLQQE